MGRGPSEAQRSRVCTENSNAINPAIIVKLPFLPALATLDRDSFPSLPDGRQVHLKRGAFVVILTYEL